jgi:heptosyltransferase-1
MGDIVMALPLLECLRRALPEAHLAWLVEPPGRALIRSHPALDAVLYWPKGEWIALARSGRWLRLLRAVLSFTRALRRQRFDLAIDAQGLFRSRALAWLSGAPQRIGFASREPGRRLMTRIVGRGPRTRRMGTEYRHLAAALGAPCDDLVPRLVIAPEEHPAARRLLRQAGIMGRYVLFCPFTTRPQKHWRNARWAQLAEGVRRRLGLPVVLLGGPGDREASGRIAALSRAPLVDLTGRTSLGGAAALVAGAHLVVGVDTGLTHMASAFQRPCIALFGATCPYLRSDSPRTIVLYHALPCSPCRRRPTCQGRFDCMAALSAAGVLAAAEGLLRGEGGADAHPAP